MSHSRIFSKPINAEPSLLEPISLTPVGAYATLEELKAVPHLGAERARALIAMRPIREVNELTAIDGIAPKRVEDICAHGVVCS